MLPPDPVMLPPICSSATNGTSLVSPGMGILSLIALLYEGLFYSTTYQQKCTLVNIFGSDNEPARARESYGE